MCQPVSLSEAASEHTGRRCCCQIQHWFIYLIVYVPGTGYVCQMFGLQWHSDNWSGCSWKSFVYVWSSKNYTATVKPLWLSDRSENWHNASFQWSENKHEDACTSFDEDWRLLAFFLYPVTSIMSNKVSTVYYDVESRMRLTTWCSLMINMFVRPTPILVTAVHHIVIALVPNMLCDI